MNHSEKYDMILGFYKGRFWKLSQVKNAVVKGLITPEEFYEITGQEYEEA